MTLEEPNSHHTLVVVVYIQEIKPWPPSHSLRSLPCVFLQWRNSDQTSGHTRHVVPTIGSGVGDGKIKFSESFNISFKASHHKYLEFNLFEPNKDNKNARDHLVATVRIDLDKYGDFKKTVCINAPLSFKTSLKITAHPVLLIKIHPVNKHCASHSSSKHSQSKGPSFSNNQVLTHSNLTLSASFQAAQDPPPEEGASQVVTNGIGNWITPSPHEPQPSKSELKQASVACKDKKETESFSSSISSESGASREEYIPFSNNHEEVETSHTTKSETPSLPSSATTICLEVPEAVAIPNNRWRSLGRADLVRRLQEKILKGRSRYNENAQHLVEGNKTNLHVNEGSFSETNVGGSESIQEEENKDGEQGINSRENDGRKPMSSSADTLMSAQVVHAKSAQTAVLDLPKGNGSVRNTIRAEDIKEIDASVVSCTGSKFSTNSENKFSLDRGKEVKNSDNKGKVRQLEYKIEKLERELREAATAEISLYSIVAEHGSSKNKLYSPARRLSRSYLHACNHGSVARRVSAAKSAVSGLVLVVKACANDVPRLTFWLSNLVALRVSISKDDENPQQHIPSTRHIELNGSRKSKDNRPSLLKKPQHKGNLLGFNDDCDDWGDLDTFMNALEKVEALIFSQITESIWLQTFALHMHIDSKKRNIPNKVLRKTQNDKRNSSLGEQEQANFSLELWKKAFKEAQEKLCPVRTGGHDCACVPVFTRLIMEHCVNRLDAALFNALLCEPTDEIPNDLVSYQVGNSKVLPVSAGVSSFRTGAQLKNVISNWSSSLSDLFNISGNKSKADETKRSFKFQLLDTLSDLMMLPKDTLLNKSFRQEVCSTFSSPLIKRILNNFVPDEFCPDQIPDDIFTALDSEDVKDNKECIQSILCNATRIVYFPPSAASLLQFKNESSVLGKSYTSDDELEEVSSPLSSIMLDEFCASSDRRKLKGNGVGSSVRHQLLREEWRDADSYSFSG